MEIVLTKSNFESNVLRSELPVLVDFWAPWCGPCRMIAPTVENAANKYEGRLVVGKVNCDEEPELCREYRIVSIPSLYIFRNGKLTERQIGFLEKDELDAFIERNL